MKRLDQRTPDYTDEHIEKIAEIFPHCLTEAEDEEGRLVKAIDFDLLRQELSRHIVDGPRERYRLDWPGKREALLAANTPITKTLRPSREESVAFDTTKNLYIEGDNLEALKLLQESYLGQVKMIYIDPPYNTGKDFVYKDNFTRSREAELTESGQMDEEGGRLVANLESNGRFHSDWLSMMYPRLRLARNLLRDDGVIFISIDDNEVHNLRKICDEVFGEGNFLANIIWEKRFTRSNNSKTFATLTEHLLCYRKSPSLSEIKEPRSEKADSTYSNPDNDPRGAWTSVSYVNPATKEQRPNLVYPIKNPITGQLVIHPTNAWKYSKATYLKHVSENKLYWGKDGNNTYPRLKKFLSEMDNGMVAVNFWEREGTGTTDEASKNLEKLMDGRVFDFPKPHTLIQRAMRIGMRKNDIILDFFSGSATTAHAVMQLNAEDGGRRRFIMVQLPEPTDEKSEAYKAGYQTIAEIGKERIRRAGRKIKEENADKEGIDDLDIGFRVLKIDSSNMKDIYYTPDEVDRESLFDTVDHIKEERSPEDLLFGVLVDWGVDLTLPIRRETIGGKTVFFVGRDDLIACFDDDLDLELIKTLAKYDALRVVFKESGFRDDETKINTEQIFKQLAPSTDVRVI